jgi:hypothetical protein
LVKEKESNDMTKDNFSPLDDVIHVIEAWRNPSTLTHTHNMCLIEPWGCSTVAQLVRP